MDNIYKISKEDIMNSLSAKQVLDYYNTPKSTSRNLYYCPIHEKRGKQGKHKPSLMVGDHTATCMSPAHNCFNGNADIFKIIGLLEHLDMKSDFAKIKSKACDIAGINYENSTKNLLHSKVTTLLTNTVLESPSPLAEKHIAYLNSRGISRLTAEEFELKGNGEYILFPQVSSGRLLGYKHISIFKKDGSRNVFFEKGASASLWYEPKFVIERDIIFVEGEKDLLRLYEELKKESIEQLYTLITVSHGAGTVPDNIANIVASLKPKSISIFYDNDKAGQTGSMKLATALLSAVDEVALYKFSNDTPNKYDISDFLNEGHSIGDLFSLEKQTLKQNDPSLIDNLWEGNCFFGLKDLDCAPPPIEWLIEGFLAKNKLCSVVATGGVGKSCFLLQLALSVSLGVNLLGIGKIYNSGNVLYISGEEDKEDINRRI